ncbi:hypothetical protein R1sor_016813 [Riccia sorocarpa]|uniref:Transposase n=1 Tax=Riccia sorocarpa TaxID=122646 RepID=A0ABD3HK10_9MARC
MVNYTNRVMTAIESAMGHEIAWPDRHKRAVNSVHFAELGFPGCIGLVDGTLVNLSQRPRDDGETYFDRKSNYSMNVHVICDQNKRVIYFFAVCAVVVLNIRNFVAIMATQAGASLHFELYTKEDDVNYIRWKWISRKEAHRVLRWIDATLLKLSGLHDALWMDWARPEEGTTSVREFILNWDDRAQSSTVGGREVLLTIDTVREYFLLIEGSLVPWTARHYDELSDWVSERSRTAKTWYANDGFLPVWKPIIQPVNVMLLSKQKPLEVTGAFLYILKNKDLTSSSPEGREVSLDPRDKPSSSSPGRHQDRPDPTNIPSSSNPSSSPGRRKQASPTRAERHHSLESSPRGAPSTLNDHATRSGSPTNPDREEPDDNEPLAGFGSPIVPYPPSNDEEEETVAVLTSLAASDPSPASKGSRPVLHRSSFESEEIRFVRPDRVKRRVADPDDDAGGPVSQQAEVDRLVAMLFLLFRHRWNGWTNIIHMTAMLLNPAYLFDEERHEFPYHSFIMRDFQEYDTLFAKGVLKYSGEELVQYLHDVDKELDEEVLEDTLQARTMRNAPVDCKLLVGSTEPTENIVYYDDLADHNFSDDTEMSLDDSAVLPGMEVMDDDALDAYFDVTSEVLPIEAIRNYTIVDDIDKTKARTLGVGEERLNQLNSRFGVQRFPHMTLNVLGVTLTTKKTRILQKIYSMPGRRTDSFDLENSRKRPKHSSSRLKPTERARTSQWENVVGPLESRAVHNIPGCQGVAQGRLSAMQKRTVLYDSGICTKDVIIIDDSVQKNLPNHMHLFQAVHRRPFDPFKTAKKDENYLRMMLQPFLDKFKDHKRDGISYVQANWQQTQGQDLITSLAGYWAPMDERDEYFLWSNCTAADR